MIEADKKKCKDKPKMSKLSKATVVSVTVLYGTFFVMLLTSDIFSAEAYNPLLYNIYKTVVSIFCFSTMIATPILGITALVRIKRSNGTLTGKGFVKIALVFWFFITLILMNPAISALQQRINGLN